MSNPMPGERFNRDLALSLSTISALAIVSVYVATQYFGLRVLDSLFFLGKDGWCPPGLSGAVGTHCFGDFGLMIKLAQGPNPWEDFHDVYTATGNLLFLPFVLVFKATGSYVFSLSLYLALMAFSLAYPALWLTRSRSVGYKVSAVALSIASFPALFALDRGNSIAFSVPFMTIFLSKIRSGDFRSASFAAVVLTLIKPQFALLFFAFLFLGKYVVALKALGASAALSVGAYAAWPNSFPNNIIDSLTNTLNYQGYQSLAAGWPTNVSLMRPVFWLEYVIHRLFGVQSSGDDFLSYATVSNTNILTALLLLFCFSFLWLRRKRLPSIQIAAVVLSISCMLTSVTFSYYLVFALPLVAVAIRESRDGVNSESLIQTHTQRRILVLALSFALVKAPLPLFYSTNGSGSVLVTTGELVPVAFLLFILAVLFAKPNVLAENSYVDAAAPRPKEPTIEAS